MSYASAKKNMTVTLLCKLNFISILFLIIRCESATDANIAKKQAEAIQYARSYSGTKSTRNWNDKYWDNVSVYIDVNEFNEVMALNRVPEQYTDTADYWRWAHQDYRLHFEKLRNELK